MAGCFSHSPAGERYNCLKRIRGGWGGCITSRPSCIALAASPPGVWPCQIPTLGLFRDTLRRHTGCCSRSDPLKSLQPAFVETGRARSCERLACMPFRCCPADLRLAAKSEMLQVGSPTAARGSVPVVQVSRSVTDAADYWEVWPLNQPAARRRKAETGPACRGSATLRESRARRSAPRKNLTCLRAAPAGQP